jgi:hypothetical protein
MANCDNIVFWSPVPPGSIFKIKGAGDINTFDVTVARSLNGKAQTPFGFKQVVPGPASQSVAKGERWVFTAVVTLFTTPTKPVTIEAWLEDPTGKKVQLPDADGKAVDLSCMWQFASTGASLIKIFVGA